MSHDISGQIPGDQCYFHTILPWGRGNCLYRGGVSQPHCFRLYVHRGTGLYSRNHPYLQKTRMIFLREIHVLQKFDIHHDH